MAMVPASRGIPTRAKEKKENGPDPASCAASETMTLTGLPVSMRSDPALPANASGMSICEGGSWIRVASTMTSGRSAATEPLRVISAVRIAQRTQTATSRRERCVPARATICWPTHVVTPVASIPSLTTNRVAMNITTGSPKPARTAVDDSTPVAQRDSAVRIATTPTGSRFQTKRTTTAARMSRLRVASSIESHPLIRVVAH
jgi:hypothetical protein